MSPQHIAKQQNAGRERPGSLSEITMHDLTCLDRGRKRPSFVISRRVRYVRSIRCHSGWRRYAVRFYVIRARLLPFMVGA